MKNKPELLAPAGNEICAYAAVQGGADSVYLGLKNFGARSYAENFDETALVRVTDYCHLRGVKVYVTLNTLTADIEINDVLASARLCAEVGVDGVIVQDLGLISLIREHYPELPVHISTQATVMNRKAMELAAELGATRAVVARELSFEEIVSIAENSSVETEIFVHGAQCYCYSGQCLMSSIYGGRSGNRGKCAGPCRLPYTLEKGGKAVEKGYLLSPVDMCLGLNIEKVLNSGAACLKIEGRMKGPEYVAACCEVYSEALGKERNITPKGLEALENTFSRGGFTAGLFEGGENRIKKQSSNDDAYANQQEELLEHFRGVAHKNERKKPAELFFRATIGKKAQLVLKVEGREFVSFSKGEVEAASSAPLDEKRIITQLEKLGDSAFKAVKTKVLCDEGIFMPVSEINAMRRQAVENAEKYITGIHKRTVSEVRIEKPRVKKAEKRFFTAVASTAEQAEVLKAFDEITEIYVPAEIYNCEKNDKFVPVFPAVIREKHLDKYIELMNNFKLAGVKKVRVNEWGMLKYAAECGFEISTGADMNVFNSRSAQVLHKLGASRVMLSSEMLVKQAGSIGSDAETEVLFYGRIALMKTANCPLKGKGVCGKNSAEYNLTDRKGEKIPIMCHCRDCTAFLFNSKPVYMADKYGEIPDGISALCLQFTVETPEEVVKIVKKCLNGESPEGEFTRGHFFRGVL